MQAQCARLERSWQASTLSLRKNHTYRGHAIRCNADFVGNLPGRRRQLTSRARMSIEAAALIRRRTSPGSCMAESREPMIFVPDPGRFTDALCAALGQAPSPIDEREFEDGEHKARPLVCVRGRDLYVVQSLHGDGARTVNDKLLRLLLFIGTLRDAGAAQVTAVLPYLAYSRKDRRTKPRDPVATRYVAELLEAMGTSRV